MTERAHARIATAAAQEALRQAVPGERALSVPPRAAVRVKRGRSRITLALAIPYPADLTAVGAHVREAVAERSAALTGTPVRTVDVTIAHLAPRPAPTAPGLPEPRRAVSPPALPGTRASGPAPDAGGTQAESANDGDTGTGAADGARRADGEPADGETDGLAEGGRRV
ncbi:hypothetical protein JJV70_12515 [Streptomyces sp. JJ66]|uniref:hypothetical protein n=1 Tax=Streptomyces sp. JJ66 TaxID=2803843 RepID=UPI001C57FD45|nr:hypothetical protein [Streptomyces sp. JJ66]MBW1602917.1 hypothetical protein [Streptomyces sp. JJ66]